MLGLLWLIGVARFRSLPSRRASGVSVECHDIDPPPLSLSLDQRELRPPPRLAHAHRSRRDEPQSKAGCHAGRQEITIEARHPPPRARLLRPTIRPSRWRTAGTV